MNLRSDRLRHRASSLACLVAVVAVLALFAPISVAHAQDNPKQVAPPKDVAELRAIEEKVKQVASKSMAYTVGVRVGAAGGSGVIVSEDGYVLTAGHVVGKPGQDVTFIFADGKTAKGKTLGMVTPLDAGLMKITEKDKKWPFAEKGKSADLKPGQWCVAVGHPLGYQPGRPPVIRAGCILRATESVIQTDCPLVGGDSGGPLFDLDGKVIGINSRIGATTSMNYHVPIDVFVKLWDRLAKGDSWKSTAPALPGRDTNPVKSAFRSIVGNASKCVVRIRCDGKDAALGTIVGPDGWILTKASELKGTVTCHFRDKSEAAARIIGIHEPFDLAMLRTDRHDLPVIPWNSKKPEVGQWVAAAGQSDDPLAIGVVSVPRRPIPPFAGVIGVMLEEGEGGPKVKSVLPKSPGQKAGIKANDIITHVNGKPSPDRQTLVTEVRKHRIGTKVKLTIKRGDQTLDLEIELGKVENDATRRRDVQNGMGVGVSKRRDAFPLVLQHDTVVRPIDCGGPLIDLSGKVVGVNIAHGGRTETYCVPADALVVVMYDLMSGRLDPKVLAARKAAAEKDQAEKAAAAAKTLAELAAAEAKAAVEAAASQKTVAEKAEAEKVAAEKKAAEAKALAEKAAREKTAAEKKAADAKTAAEEAAESLKAAQEKAATEQKAADEAAKKAAEQRAAAEKKALEEDAKKKTAAEAAQKAAEEVAKKAVEEKAAAEKLAEQETAKRKAAEEAAKKAAEEKAVAEKRARDEAAARKVAEEAAKKAADEKAAIQRQLDEEIAKRKAAAEKARQEKADAERAAEEAAQRKAAELEEEVAKLKAAEIAAEKARQEKADAERRAAEEAAKKAAEEEKSADAEEPATEQPSEQEAPKE